MSLDVVLNYVNKFITKPILTIKELAFFLLGIIVQMNSINESLIGIAKCQKY
jgi:hypothetical protein